MPAERKGIPVLMNSQKNRTCPLRATSSLSRSGHGDSAIAEPYAAPHAAAPHAAGHPEEWACPLGQRLTTSAATMLPPQALATSSAYGESSMRPTTANSVRDAPA